MTKKFRKIIMWCVSAVFFLKHFNANDMSGMFRSSKAKVAVWASYYRVFPYIFVKEYLGITLKPFQSFLIFMMSDVTDMSDIARNSSGTVLDKSSLNLDENNLEGDERQNKLGEEDEF